MQLELMDTIQLVDNRKYIVSNSTIIDNKKYYLFINDEIETDIVIGYIDSNDLVMIDDPKEYTKILSSFDCDKILNKLGDLYSNNN